MKRDRRRTRTAPFVTDAAGATMAYWKRALGAEPPLFVYFIQELDDGPVKIGEAQRPVARLEGMQTGNPRELQVAAVVLAGRTTEWQLHGYWRHSAGIRGEWFGRGHQATILEQAAHIAAAQIEAHRNRTPIDDVRETIFVRELFGWNRLRDVV